MPPDPHDLAITQRPLDRGHITVGRCSCGLFSMVGPADTIRGHHATHVAERTAR
jgi:hypothetical protein